MRFGESRISVQAARVAREKCELLEVQVFSDRDIATQKDKIEAALEEADVFFGSLLFDYDQVRTSCPGAFTCKLGQTPFLVLASF